MINKVVLCGAGKRCKMLCQILQFSDIEIVAIMDNAPDKWGTEIEGYLVSAPKRIEEYQNIIWCITVGDKYASREIRMELQQRYQYRLENEVSFKELILKAYRESPRINKYILDQKVYNRGKDAILFDCYNGLGLGGVQAWTMDVCKALINDGEDRVYIISDNGVYEVPFVLENHIISVNINHKGWFEAGTILNIIDAIMPKLPCKIVTCTTDEVMLAAYLIKRYYPDMVEVISVIHNSNESVYKDYIDFKDCSDLYIGVSQDIRNDMIQKGVAPEKIFSMTCPFFCEKILNRNYSDLNSPICIGYAGRMDGMEHSQKRMDLLLKLMKILMERNVYCKFELAGDGPARQMMEEFVCHNDMCANVKFLGRLERSEVAAFWKRQDICVNLADYEGRCISKLEAMGNGAVPIITATAGAKEDIIDGLNGYIVPLGDYYAMADRIEYLAQHREQLYRMGELAHDAVYPKSSMKVHIEFWKEVFRIK